MSEKKGRKQRLDKTTLDKLGHEWVSQVFDTWCQYNDSVLWLLHNDGDPKEVEENREKASIYYEAWLDLLISLKRRKE